MDPIAEKSPVMEKTRELCETILKQPEIKGVRTSVENFLADKDAQYLYRSLSEKREFLENKQREGNEVTEGDLAEFEKDRQSLLGNPVASGFLDAQETMHQVEQTVRGYVSKTFELGRVPEQSDFDSGSCGPSCGCH